LPGTSFQGCTFDYATFERTLIEPEILKTGCPGFENLQMRFARSLRINYQELGDSDAANEAILVELAATEAHLKKAAFSRESYYRAKYRGLNRAAAIAALVKFKALDLIWGNGEKATRLIFTLLVVLVCMALFDVFNFRDRNSIVSYIEAFLLAPKILIGAVEPMKMGVTYLSVVALIRLIGFALLVSIILKRFHRR
jgi:hypothetical protein